MSTSHHLSLDEYNRLVNLGAFRDLDCRIELLHGELVEMNPAGPLHDDYIDFLMDWSYRSNDRSKIRVRGQTSVNIADSDSRPEPDIFWVVAKRYRTSHPTERETLLIVEVSDRSLERDLSIKSKLFATAAIQEYWVVDIQNECVHVMREPDGHGFFRSNRVVRPSEVLSPLAEPLALLDISELFGP